MAEKPEDQTIPVESAPIAEAPSEVSVETTPVETAVGPHDEPSLLERAAAEEAPGEEAKAEAAPVEGAETPAEAKPEEVKAEQPKVEVKPEEAKPDVEAKPEEAKAVEVEPIDYAYEIPEFLVMDDAQKGEFKTALDAFRKDPAGTGAQAILDMGAKAMAAHAQKLQDEQNRVWTDTKHEWETAVKADPVIGGAGYQTAMRQIAGVRDRFASDHKPGTKEYAEDLKAFDAFTRITGAGSHPIFLRMLHRLAKFSGEPTQIPTDIKPAPNSGRKRGSRSEILYDNSPSMNGRS